MSPGLRVEPPGTGCGLRGGGAGEAACGCCMPGSACVRAALPGRSVHATEPSMAVPGDQLRGEAKPGPGGWGTSPAGGQPTSAGRAGPADVAGGSLPSEAMASPWATAPSASGRLGVFVDTLLFIGVLTGRDSGGCGGPGGLAPRTPGGWGGPRVSAGFPGPGHKPVRRGSGRQRGVGLHKRMETSRVFDC